MAWTIFRERWQHAYYFGSNNISIFFDLVCILLKMWYPTMICSRKKCLNKKFFIWQYDAIAFDVYSRHYSKYYLLAD